jgi:hypothetical protein
MILDSIDFTDFYNGVENVFSNHFSSAEVKQLMEYVEILSDANFRCYKANMIVIQLRKTNSKDHKTISEMEWVARSVF